MIKFGCCVILKKSPFHIMCLDEKDAREIIEREKENVVLVLFADSGIQRRFVEKKIGLVGIPQKFIETTEINDIGAIPDELIEESRRNLKEKMASEAK